MKAEQAKKQLDAWVPKYLIVGFVHDGYKGIPVTYEESTMIFESKEELLEALDEFYIFKVFHCGEQLSQDELIEEKNTRSKEETEKKELAQLQALLKKYPQT